MFDCFMQDGFQENLQSWQTKFEKGIFEFRENKPYYIDHIIQNFYKSFKANTDNSIADLLPICDHPDWNENIPKLFSMHASRDPASNNLLYKKLEEGTGAALNIIDSFLTTGNYRQVIKID